MFTFASRSWIIRWYFVVCSVNCFRRLTVSVSNAFRRSSVYRNHRTGLPLRIDASLPFEDLRPLFDIVVRHREVFLPGFRAFAVVQRYLDRPLAFVFDTKVPSDTVFCMMQTKKNRGKSGTDGSYLITCLVVMDVRHCGHVFFRSSTNHRSKQLSWKRWPQGSAEIVDERKNRSKQIVHAIFILAAQHYLSSQWILDWICYALKWNETSASAVGVPNTNSVLFPWTGPIESTKRDVTLRSSTSF